jgi:hypothetical protein
MPVNRCALREVICDVYPHAAALLKMNARSWNLRIEGVGVHRHGRENCPANDRRIEFETTASALHQPHVRRICHRETRDYAHNITPQNNSSRCSIARMSRPIIRKFIAGAMPAVMKFMLMNSGIKLFPTLRR